MVNWVYLSSAKKRRDSAENTNDMPNSDELIQTGLTPLEKEMRQLAADIAAELALVSARERTTLACSLEIHDDTLQSYGKRVPKSKLPLGYRILEALRQITADRKQAA